MLPALAEGLIQRRPRAMARAERKQADRTAIDLVRDLRARYGEGPLGLRAGPRRVALLLTADDLERVLRQTPEPFSPAAWEKRRALDRFQPHGSLISGGEPRRARRRINEAALDLARPPHAELLPALAARVTEEAGRVAREAEGGVLAWEGFAAGWWRAVRRAVLGDAAREDTDLTGRLAALRAAGNWSLLGPRRRLPRAEFLVRVQRYAFHAPPDTLAGQLRALDTRPEADPVGQVPHWLFAFDAGGAATLRALALLAAHEESAERAAREAAEGGPGGPWDLPFLRACVQESVRLWPTTPLLLRESTEDTRWRGTLVPRGTAFVAYTPYFHRAEPAAPYGDAFAPGIWLDGRAAGLPALVPFSAGPGACPGEDVVLLTASLWLAALLRRHRYALGPKGPLRPGRRIPATLDHFALRLTPHPA
ncbi:cytochrome P450 [Streptomyces hoynatensis]|uniref:cytochrome P450 n=1 Tax=Streptomyces hoynatensis TaxID=1141874 RepID=UPI001F4D4000|nr:cytochrome P450 [Streptomyces hoynatensis]